MDWFLDATDAQTASAVRGEAIAYLRRHAGPGSDLFAAEVAIGELLANVVRHASGPAWVEVDWSREQPLLTVRDLGPGFTLEEVPPPSTERTSGRGLYIVSQLAENLRASIRKAGGAEVSTILPVRRAPASRPQPKRPSIEALPGPGEASGDGSFQREPFLRALVVQLAQHVDLEHGPEASEAAVTQVGADIGGRMEQEYRRARAIVGRLSEEQMADLFVRLKAAIGGDFYVIEADEDKIVLGNRRCPFGEAVTRAPALCRMTSSVLGGIARRNRGWSAVQLEERIAVGDPGCRVVVWLRDPERGLPSYAHVYEGAAEAPEPQLPAAPISS
jgi:anti-sigma regulatory factor (Ser/Thr protein kinase)/predicted ArsR family transcriptional regulator